MSTPILRKRLLLPSLPSLSLSSISWITGRNSSVTVSTDQPQPSLLWRWRPDHQLHGHNYGPMALELVTKWLVTTISPIIQSTANSTNILLYESWAITHNSIQFFVPHSDKINYSNGCDIYKCMMRCRALPASARADHFAGLEPQPLRAQSLAQSSRCSTSLVLTFCASKHHWRCFLGETVLNDNNSGRKQKWTFPRSYQISIWVPCKSSEIVLVIP